MKRVFIFFYCLCASFYCFGQTYNIEGQVSKDNKPLAKVNVNVEDTTQATYTDKNGHYRLELPKGKYTLVFVYGNQKKIHVNLNKNKTLDIDMTGVSNQLEEVFISSLRVDADSPMTYSNMSHEEIDKQNLGQDIPILMNDMPNVVSTSDAGNGIGYTGIRVRGSDATRVNVTLNGVPLNDAESQGTIWVDLGDFTNSVEDLQLQRGVGTSTNGAGAFGASLNVRTDQITENPSAEITNTYGSFNTHKHQFKFNTGRFNKHFAVSGNVSYLKSDGYRDRAFSDLKSYYFQGLYESENTKIKALAFGGNEETYQAYYGITPEQLERNRKFNPAGMYKDSTGTTKFYDNQTDNYKQNHYQLMWHQTYDPHWSSNLTFHYTRGKGYYESYHEDADLQNYGLSNFEHNNSTITTSDLVNRKWLDNDFYGTVFDVDYKKKGTKLTFGGAWNRYTGDHYGDVIYTRFSRQNEPFAHYYDNNGTKIDFNAYAKATLALTDKFSAFGDLQLRHISYKTKGPYEQEDFSVSDRFTFFNPKVGLTYEFNPSNEFYASYARANKEPNRGDYKSAVLGQENPKYPEEESLNDFELGWRHNSGRFQLNSNIYYMNYHNQLVLTGEIDPQGRFIRKNSGKSYRLGLELDADIKVSPKFDIRPNLALSHNQNKDYKTTLEDEIKEYGSTKISFSPQIVGGNELRYAPIKNLNLSFFTKFVGNQYMSNIEAEASKLDSYWVNNLTIEYNWTSAPVFKKITFTAMINNIFDEKYISNGNYTPDGGPLYYPQAGINVLTGIKLKF